MKKRKIVYITGTRADFGLMYSTLSEINNNPKFDLSLIVTGMHLSKKYGYTIDLVKNSWFKIGMIIKLFKEETATNKDMAFALGKAIIAFTKAFEKIKPEIILIEGDRFEALAAAVSGAFLNIAVVHISGGDISRSIDDSIRHAVTKFAHIHLPGTKKSAERIIKMGEENWRVHMVGTPINKNFCSKYELEELFKLDFNKPVLLVIQHPITTQSDLASEQMKETMEAIKELNEQTVIIYPNTDAGGAEMIGVIDRYKKMSNLRIIPNIPSEQFMGLLKYSSVIIGNSSAGIVESSYFNTPCVNIGIRQEGRERAGNVIDVNYKKNEILNAVRKCLTEKFRKHITTKINPYKFDGVEKRIVRILANLKINKKLFNKNLTY